MQKIGYTKRITSILLAILMVLSCAVVFGGCKDKKDIPEDLNVYSYDNSGNILTSNPGFKDAATGNFTIYAGSDQAKEQTGDPRWLVEFDPNLSGIDGINAAATLNGAVYTINGIKVREAGETLKGLSKGMYIINGKKYVVK